MHASSAACLSLLKRACASLDDQERQVNKTHGTGRWRGYFARNTSGPAASAEAKLVEPPLNNGRVGRRRATRCRPKRLIADRGYDSNRVWALLVKQYIEP